MKQYGKQGASKAGPTNLGYSTEAGPGYKAKKAIENALRPRNQAQQMALDKGKRIVGGVKQIAKEAYKNPGQAAKFAGKQIMANKGKAGLALGALAAAGGLGVAGLKALGARKKKQANSLQGRLASASKMFR